MAKTVDSLLGRVNLVFKKLFFSNRQKQKKECAFSLKYERKNMCESRRNKCSKKSENTVKSLTSVKTAVNKNIKSKLEKFPIEIINSLEICGYDISALSADKLNNITLIEKLNATIKEFNHEELKLISKDIDKVYAIGEFMNGGYKETGIPDEKYLELVRKMIA